MASSANEMLAAANRSNGAPSTICFSSRPVEPKLKMTFSPVFFSKAAPTSLNASARSAAAATLIGDGDAIARAPNATIRSATLVLIDDRPDIFALESARHLPALQTVDDLQLGAEARARQVLDDDALEDQVRQIGLE